jgi:opacity protein-like surface antigen
MTGRFLIAFLLALHLFAAPAARAAEDQTAPGTAELANPFSDFVPFEDEYDIDEDERFMYFGRFFAVSLGTGMHVFGGNIGKLYNTAIPVLDFRLIYFFDFRLAGEIGVSSASHAFNAAPNGAVNVSLLRLNADLKYYFDTKNVGAAITYANPYVIAGVSQTFRTQAFQDHNSVEKDNAFAVSAGAGMEFALKPRKTSIGVEGRIHQIFFQDRFDQEYLESGLADLTGPMYSFITSLIFFF